MAIRVSGWMGIAAAAVCAVLLTGPFAGRATADEMDQRTVVTFSNPVEIPGQVLPAGTYVFKLSAIQTERETIQIYNADESRLIATEITIPVDFVTPPSNAMFEMRETAAGNPPQLREFAYPGATCGHEFVYKNTGTTR